MLADVQLEDVGMALAMTVKTQLPQALLDVQAEQSAKEAAWAAVLGPMPQLAALPEPASWFVGHHPSILDRPAEDFPCVVVMCYDHNSGTPADPWSTDQTEVMAERCYVEAAVSLPITDLSSDIEVALINRMATRYASAIHRSIVRGETLGGIVQPIEQTPHVLLGGTNRRRVTVESDASMYVQASRLEYTFKRTQQW